MEASRLPRDDGLKEERRLFNECMDSPQRAGLIHAFFAERAVAKVPEASATPRDVQKIGVIGGGTMGSGIATAALLAGFDVTMTERDQAGLDRGKATITSNLDGAVKRGKLTSEARETILSQKLSTATDLDALGDADLIIEAVFEDMGVKREIFETLDKVAKPGAVLASNTSYLDVKPDRRGYQPAPRRRRACTSSRPRTSCGSWKSSLRTRQERTRSPRALPLPRS